MKLFYALSLTAATLLFSGCGDNNSKPEGGENLQPKPPKSVEKSFTVTLINLTAGQPMSPLAVVASDTHSPLFSLGSSASTALETLAEGGNNAELLKLSTATASGSGPIAPGAKSSVTIETKSYPYLNIASMLVATNDTFLAKQNIALETLAVGESYRSEVRAYDAGTEANSESAATLPGLGGEGFNAARDDVNFVSTASGVVTKDDGLSTSGLTAVHKFDNPTGFLVVTRTK